jgi:DNA helicase II / ATP-dependent DNA helicase PcrA
MTNQIDNNLNTQQKKAVLNNDKYTLIMASAGTGKTRVLVSKFLHILTQNIQIQNIMALTFTNKAAKEMLTRISKEGGLFIGTFHSICLRLLKQYNHYYPNVIDEDDSRKILETLGYSADIIWNIKQFQDKGLLAEQVEHWNPIKEIYLSYLNALKKQNLIDFGHIILETITMLQNPEIGPQIRKQFSHILVDEYQDTSMAQEKLLQLLIKDGAYLFVVGDPRQSVYEWRGAHRDNIIKFTERYNNATVIKLNENYRSTREILNFATAVMNSNKTDDENDKIFGQYNGEKVKIYTTQNAEQESKFIASKIHELRTRGFNYKDIAILARSNMALRLIEQNLSISSIPYKIFGGIKFFERDEIKTLVCYLRLIINPKDALAFTRVIQNPKRGIGLKTLQELKQFANPFANMDKIKISKKAYENLKNLNTSLLKWKNDLLTEPNLTFFILRVLEESGLNDYYTEQRRLNNLKQLAELAGNFKQLSELVNSFFSLEDEITEQDEISLMTFHMSKGLEFPIVFLPCWSEGFFPNPRSVSEGNVDEERRLAYVAITRAKKFLYILSYENIAPSRFLKNAFHLADIFKINQQF